MLSHRGSEVRLVFFFFSSRRRHTRFKCDWSSDVCSSDLATAIRATQEWIHRTQAQVLAVRSRFSLGVEALGATLNHDGIPDSRFFAWLGQRSEERRVGKECRYRWVQRW